MRKIIMFGVRDEERTVAENWAKEHQVELSINEENFTPELIERVKDYDGLSLSQVGKLDESLYAQLHQMGIKQIAQRSAGVDMYNLALAKENDIIISNVPSYSPESIAEWTVAMALNIIRKYDLIQERVNEHNFSWTPEIRGRLMGDMKVAVLGTGRIGQAVARFFKGFGCEIIGYDLYPNSQLSDLLTYGDSIEEVIKDADIISLHMPATEENYHLFDKELLLKCKKDAILLNMARGALIDTKALIEVLDEGHLMGVGLDTYEEEGPLIPKNLTDQTIEDELFLQVINHPKIIYSPHIAFYTDEAVKNLVEGGLNATLEVIETGTTRNRVN